jgi:GT2 family glycosyltransferase
MKRIGAVIPVFNRSNELQLLLTSLSAQTFTQQQGELDILIVDNASSDGGLDRVFPENVSVLRLPTNLGACQGFNRGVQFLLARGGYDFLWLLDSDLWAAPDALSRLVAAMESDPAIGLAGSMIVNANDHRVLVEAGAMIDLPSGSVNPVFCNEPVRDAARIIPVDYVGSGVSLLRIETAQQAGYYDERYHFLWEDMDYGLFVKRCGWKVVAVTDSIVYHPPFTEKRSAAVDAYYGVRNPLLTMSKYCGVVARIPAFHRYLRKGCKGLMFRRLSGANPLSTLTWRAFRDFVSGRFGSIDLGVTDIMGHGMADSEQPVLPMPYILLPSGNLKTITEVIRYIKERGGEKIIFVIQKYRLTLFNTLPVDRIMLYDDKSPHLVWEHLKIFIKLLFTPGIVINPDPLRGSPFTYSHKVVTVWDAKDGCLRGSHENIMSIWKLVTAVITGEFLALLLLIPVLLRSYCLKPRRFELESRL